MTPRLPVASALSAIGRLALLVATVARHARAIRDTFDTYSALSASQRYNRSKSGGLGGTCCCRGPKEKQCWWIGLDMGYASCPQELGYFSPDTWGLGKRTLSNCEKQLQVQTKGETVTVTAYVMRHAYSCSNVGADQWQKFDVRDPWPWDYDDPPLTDAGVLRSRVLGTIIRKELEKLTKGRQPLVFASFMSRAIETAWSSFPEAVVHPIPFISEMDNSPSSTPLPYEEQARSRLGLLRDSDKSLTRLAFDVATEDHPFRHSDSALKHDHDLFLSFLPGALEELSSFELGGEPGRLPASPPPGGWEIPVVIVTHGGVMQKHLQCGQDNPANNAVLVQTYQFQWGTWNAKLEKGGCTKMFEPEFIPFSPAVLCEGDVARCSAEFMPNVWLQRDNQTCKGLSAPSTIVDRDLDNGLKYTGHQTFRSVYPSLDYSVAHPHVDGRYPPATTTVTTTITTTTVEFHLAPCTISDRSRASGMYPCICGEAICQKNEICHDGESKCTLAPCTETGGDKFSEAYPCQCDEDICTEEEKYCSGLYSQCSATPY